MWGRGGCGKDSGLNSEGHGSHCRVLNRGVVWPDLHFNRVKLVVTLLPVRRTAWEQAVCLVDLYSHDMAFWLVESLKTYFTHEHWLSECENEGYLPKPGPGSWGFGKSSHCWRKALATDAANSPVPGALSCLLWRRYGSNTHLNQFSLLPQKELLNGSMSPGGRISEV